MREKKQESKQSKKPLVLVFALAALALLMQFLTDLQHGFTAGLPLSLTVWSAVSRVCHQRAAK